MNRVLFFSFLQDVVGQNEVIMDASGKMVVELKNEVAEIYNFTNMDTVMTAINEEFVLDEEIIKSGDVVAFIPPVSGG